MQARPASEWFKKTEKKEEEEEGEEEEEEEGAIEALKALKSLAGAIAAVAGFQEPAMSVLGAGPWGLPRSAIAFARTSIF